MNAQKPMIDFSLSAAYLPGLVQKRVVIMTVASELKNGFEVVFCAILADFLVPKIISCSRFSTKKNYQKALKNLDLAAQKILRFNIE